MVEKAAALNRTYTHCGVTFKRVVGYTTGMNGGKRAAVSDQVKCPVCQNFIPTGGKRKTYGK
jgi:hypothetical protein